MEKPAELVAKDSVVATWNLMRDPGWREVKGTLWNPEDEYPSQQSGAP